MTDIYRRRPSEHHPEIQTASAQATSSRRTLPSPLVTEDTQGSQSSSTSASYGPNIFSRQTSSTPVEPALRSPYQGSGQSTSYRPSPQVSGRSAPTQYAYGVPTTGPTPVGPGSPYRQSTSFSPSYQFDNIRATLPPISPPASAGFSSQYHSATAGPSSAHGQDSSSRATGSTSGMQGRGNRSQALTIAEMAENNESIPRHARHLPPLGEATQQSVAPSLSGRRHRQCPPSSYSPYPEPGSSQGGSRRSHGSEERRRESSRQEASEKTLRREQRRSLRLSDVLQDE